MLVVSTTMVNQVKAQGVSAAKIKEKKVTILLSYKSSLAIRRAVAEIEMRMSGLRQTCDKARAVLCDPKPGIVLSSHAARHAGLRDSLRAAEALLANPLQQLRQ